MTTSNVNNVCAQDIAQINIKARINNSREIIQIQPYMLDSGNRNKYFYTTCLTAFEKDSLKGQKNEKKKLSLYNALNATRRYGVTSNLIKLFTNKDKLESVVNWLVQNDIDKKNKIEPLKKSIESLTKLLNMPNNIKKYFTELNQLLKNLIYSKDDLLNIKQILKDLSDENTSNISALTVEIKKAESEISAILLSMKKKNKEFFNLNNTTIISILFPTGGVFTYADKQYYIKSVTETQSLTITRRKTKKHRSNTIFIKLNLVKTKQELRSYGSLDCREKKFEITRKFNEVYGSLLGKYNVSYDSSKYSLSKIGKQIDIDKQILKKRNKKQRELEKKKRDKEKFDSALVKLLKGGNRKTRKHPRSNSMRKTRKIA